MRLIAVQPFTLRFIAQQLLKVQEFQQMLLVFRATRSPFHRDQILKRDDAKVYYFPLHV